LGREEHAAVRFIRTGAVDTNGVETELVDFGYFGTSTRTRERRYRLLAS